MAMYLPGQAANPALNSTGMSPNSASGTYNPYLDPSQTYNPFISPTQRAWEQEQEQRRQQQQPAPQAAPKPAAQPQMNADEVDRPAMQALRQSAPEPDPPPQAPSGGGGMPSFDMGGMGMFQMPSMAMGAPEPPQAAAAPQAQATAGLQAAGPDMTAAASFRQGSSPGGINPNLGRRNVPNEISGLRALTY